ncbi:hypothetical protein M3Y94_00632400 [Aphelenchoides besseyi]|nr:hypothetical protein M3Y94_00632400 [Aphelenchoides besseyi]
MFLVVLIGIAAVVLGFLFWHREAGVEAEAVVKEKMREEKSRYPVGLPVKFDKPTSEKKLKNEDGTRRMVENNEADELKIENVSAPEAAKETATAREVSERPSAVNKSSIQLDATQPDKSLNLDVTQKPLEAQEEPKEADVKSGDSKKKKKHKKRSKSSRSSSKKSKKKSKRSKKKDADASGAPNKPDDQPNV